MRALATTRPVDVTTRIRAFASPAPATCTRAVQRPEVKRTLKAIAVDCAVPGVGRVDGAVLGEVGLGDVGVDGVGLGAGVEGRGVLDGAGARVGERVGAVTDGTAGSGGVDGAPADGLGRPSDGSDGMAGVGMAGDVGLPGFAAPGMGSAGMDGRAKDGAGREGSAGMDGSAGIPGMPGPFSSGGTRPPVPEASVTLIRPAPVSESLPSAPRSMAVCLSRLAASRALTPRADMTTATAPAAYGAAMDVPDMVM